MTTFGIKLVIIRFVSEVNVSVAVMDKISNFPLNTSRKQEANYFRDINYCMVKKLIVARKGVDIAPCPPPKYATEYIGPRQSSTQKV